MHMLQAEAGTLTNQGTGEIRDEALKRSVVVLKPSNKGIRDPTFLSGGCNSSLGSPIRCARLLPRDRKLALKVGDPLLRQTQQRLRRHQLTRRDKALANFFCLRSNRLESLVRLLHGGKFLLRATLCSKPISRLTVQTLYKKQAVNNAGILSAHPLKFSDQALGDWRSKILSAHPLKFSD